MEEIKKHWFLITFILAAIGTAGVWIATIDSKTFDSPEEKVNVVDHVLKSPKPEQIWEKYYKDKLKRRKDSVHRAEDSINNIIVQKSRALRDSLLIEEHKINEKNAVQLYQLKDEIQKIKKDLENQR